MAATLDFIFGFHCHVNHGLAFQGNKAVLFLSGQMCISHSLEKGQQKFFPIPELEYPTALASGPKNFIAVADSSGKARVTMYDVESSVRKVMPDPEVNVEEYICLCFSSDFKYLAAQGGPPTWAMPVWSWDKKSLKTVYVPVSLQPHMEILEICFHPRDSDQIVAVGKHYFRFYKYEGEEGFKPFIFAKYELQDCDFLSIAWLPRERLAIGTGDGRILMFDGIEQRYEIVVNIPMDEEKGILEVESQEKAKGDEEKEAKKNPVSCIHTTSKGLLCVFGENTVVEYIRTDDNKNYKFKQSIHIPYEPPTVQIELGEVVDVEDKITYMDLNPDETNLAVCTDRGQIFQFNLEQKDIKKMLHKYFEAVTQPVHKEAVIALDVAVKRPIIVSCSQHTIIFWDYVKRKQEMQKRFYDEMLSVGIHPLGLHLVIGFAEYTRVFTILTDGLTEIAVLKVKSCTEISFSHAGHMFAVTNGPRIEIYNFITLQQIALFKGHHGTLKNIEWNENDTILVSCDDKGAIYIWDMISKQRVSENVVKGTAYSSVAVSSDGNEIYAVGSDKLIRTFSRFEIRSVTPTHVELTALSLSHSGHMLFGATVQGCLRTFRFPLTSVAASTDTHAHLDQVTKLKITFGDTYLITSGEDGMICLWKIVDTKKEEKVVVQFSVAVLIDQDVLNKHSATVKELKAQLGEIDLETQYQLRLKDMLYKQQLKDLSESHEHERTMLNMSITQLSQEKERVLAKHKEEIVRLKESNQNALDEMERSTRDKLLFEYERYDDLVEKQNTSEKSMRRKMDELKMKNQMDVAKMVSAYEKEVTKMEEIIKEERERSRMKDEKYKEIWVQIEDEADVEVTEVKSNFSRNIQIQKEEIERLKEANEVAKKKISNQQHDIDVLHENIRQQNFEEKKLKSVISDLEKEIKEKHSLINNKDANIQELQERLFALNQDKQELEKHEFVASFSYDALKKEIEPKEQEVARSKKLIKKLNADLEIAHKKTNMDQKEIFALSERLKATENHLAKEKIKLRNTETILKRLQADLSMCSKIILEPTKLKNYVKLLMKKHLETFKVETTATDFDLNAEFTHQREHLEKSIAVLRKRLFKEGKSHRIEFVRMVEENSQLIACVNALHQEVKGLNQKIRDMEAAFGLKSTDFSLEGGAIRRKIEAVVAATRKEAKQVSADLSRKDTIIEKQQEELRRLHGLIVVKEEGKVVKP